MKIGFLFSGQGAQYPGMMKDIAAHSKLADKVLKTADSVLDRRISDLIFEGTQDELALTHNTQPCVLAADLLAFYAVQEAGIVPDAVAGFSLGEYGALVSAGVIGLEEVFPLIQIRADLMQLAVPVGEGAMAAVMKLSEEEVRALCSEVDGYVVPANYNCPGQIVVSGEAKAVDELMEIAKLRKIRAIKLPVSAPFHCDLMQPSSDGLRIPLGKVNMQRPAVPVYMNVDGQPETEPEKIFEKLVSQAKSPVHWEKTLRNMYRDGIDTFVELGPGKTLLGFVNKTFNNGEEIRAYNVTDLNTLEKVIQELTGAAL